MERKTPRFKKSHVNYSELLHLARAGVIFVSWSFETALIFGAYVSLYEILREMTTFSVVHARKYFVKKSRES